MDAGQNGMPGLPAPNPVKAELREERELAPGQARNTVVKSVGARILK